MTGHLFIGLISGTSRDGVDAALVDFDSGRPKLIQGICTAYPDRLRLAVDRLIHANRRPAAADCASLDHALGRFFATAALDLVRQAGVKAGEVAGIGSHGQTVWHEPDGDAPVSLQLGDGAVIASATGLRTVSDFRSADLAQGGQGAPLAPLLHRRFLWPGHGPMAVLNLGGIANLTLIDDDGSVRGWDTGPANCLMDLWIRHHRDMAFDPQGAWAAEGKVLDSLLVRLREDAYFRRPPPKSTGLEWFNGNWLKRRLGASQYRPADVQRTLLELTARTVADDLLAFGSHGILQACGGGVHNATLMGRLAELLPGFTVVSTAQSGIDPDWVEAVLFAWLARERLQNREQDTRGITGARTEVLLGTIHEPGGME